MAQSGALLDVSYIVSVVAMTGVLVWGLKMLSRELGTVDAKTGLSYMAEALREKEPPRNARGDDGTVVSDRTSFSRVAGALGAVGLAAVFVGIGYWTLYQLHFGDDLTKLSALSPYFMAGAALFVPYASNKLVSIFK